MPPSNSPPPSVWQLSWPLVLAWAGVAIIAVVSAGG